MLHKKYEEELKKYEALINRKNEVDPDFYNGVYDKYKTEVLEYINIVNKKRSGQSSLLDKKFTKTDSLCAKCGKELESHEDIICDECLQEAYEERLAE